MNEGDIILKGANVEIMQIGSGCIGGAEGAVTLHIQGSKEKV